MINTLWKCPGQHASQQRTLKSVHSFIHLSSGNTLSWSGQMAMLKNATNSALVQHVTYFNITNQPNSMFLEN